VNNQLDKKSQSRLATVWIVLFIEQNILDDKKLHRLLLVLLAMLMLCRGYSQSVQIETNNKSLKQIIAEVEQQASVRFSYSDNVIGKINFVMPNNQLQSVDQLIDRLRMAYRIGSQEIDGQIVLFKLAPHEMKYYYVSGVMVDSTTSESIIGGAVHSSIAGIGTTTNVYGYFSLYLPQGKHQLRCQCLGYKQKVITIDVSNNEQIKVQLEPVVYQMSEVTVRSDSKDDIVEATESGVMRMSVNTLRHLPNVMGEHDALRNLDLMSGIQMSEMSSSSINIQGGSSDQTTFMMDGVENYMPSHLGGFASGYNPDIINHINIYKGDISIENDEALSGIIDVRLRNGDLYNWHVSASMGIFTLRALAEGPLVKGKTSVLLAARRTYADLFLAPILRAQNYDADFYFYDINAKVTTTLNNHNRIFFSYYVGFDKFDVSSKLKQTNRIASVRWNHFYNRNLLSNLTLSVIQHETQLNNFYTNRAYSWQNLCFEARAKLDFMHNVTQAVNLKYGAHFAMFRLEPFDLISDEKESLSKRLHNKSQRMDIAKLYFVQNYQIGNNLAVDFGNNISASKTPTNYQNISDTIMFYYEGNLTAKYRLAEGWLLKAGFSTRAQTLHKLQTSTYGVTINRLLPANSRFMPERSNNLSVNLLCTDIQNLTIEVGAYYRRQFNIIESLQEIRLLYDIDPEKFIYHSSAKIYGIETSVHYTYDNLQLKAAFNYTNSSWTTNGLNQNSPYQASYVRKHSIDFTALYSKNRLSASASWKMASGLPYTSAVGTYNVDGNPVLQFSDNINTMRMPLYHRLDVSLELKGRNNDIKRYNTFWNFSVYNVYAHKNPLGISYYSSDDNGHVWLNPSFYYIYRFVPSLSYRIEF